MSGKNQLKKIVATLIVGLSVSATGVGLTWYQVSQSELKASAISAAEAVNVTENLLLEIQKAAELATPLLLQPCTSESRAYLSRLAIGVEPVRMINIFKDGRLLCSSYNAAEPDREKINAEESQKLILSTDDYISPGVPVMILRTSHSAGEITVSIATHWSAKTLKILSQHRPLTMRAGNIVLTGDNRLVKRPRQSKVHAVHSALFPFSVEYSAKHIIPFMTYLNEGALSFLLSGLLGLFVAISLWVVKFRPKSLNDELYQAIRHGEIVPWYQPIINTATGQISGVEVLARWVKPEGQIITPDSFIYEAERSGLITDITRLLMAKVAEELPKLPSFGADSWHIGFNVTQSQILETGFVAECLEFISAFPSGSIYLTLELTEREPFDGSQVVKDRLICLRNYGIAIALDDFGTGYANMEYLGQFSFDYIKIDRVFVNRIGQGKEAETLLVSLIDIASSLNMNVIAEGVENEEQVVWLRRHGVGGLQGYFYSRPVPIEKLKSII